tara:strand:- start:1267 stop:2079 length:813 start_codon:yes stop_codon:yes gene_type:complete
MKILINKNDLKEALNSVSNLGFVPTMGGLHRGHISLIERSKNECNKTLVSIFVNPTQFNNTKDYNKYPRNKKKDLSILRKLKVDFVFLPNNKDIYDTKRKIKIKIPKKDKILCAKYRKGHFEGVIDVMDRLTRMIKPKKIFMGEKDFQQLYLIKNYFKKRNKSEIISCKTIRDNHKLALSSRNMLLDKKGLFIARSISKNLIYFKQKISTGGNIKKKLALKKKELNLFDNIKIEYLELRNKFDLKKTLKIKNSKVFIGYYINDVRLIDNF